MDEKRSNRRSSILKRRTSEANLNTTVPTKRRISFSEKKSIKEFTDGNDKATIWMTSYEESDALHNDQISKGNTLYDPAKTNDNFSHVDMEISPFDTISVGLTMSKINNATASEQITSGSSLISRNTRSQVNLQKMNAASAVISLPPQHQLNTINLQPIYSSTAVEIAKFNSTISAMQLSDESLDSFQAVSKNAPSHMDFSHQTESTQRKDAMEISLISNSPTITQFTVENNLPKSQRKTTYMTDENISLENVQPISNIEYNQLTKDSRIGDNFLQNSLTKENKSNVELVLSCLLNKTMTMEESYLHDSSTSLNTDKHVLITQKQNTSEPSLINEINIATNKTVLMQESLFQESVVSSRDDLLGEDVKHFNFQINQTTNQTVPLETTLLQNKSNNNTLKMPLETICINADNISMDDKIQRPVKFEVNNTVFQNIHLMSPIVKKRQTNAIERNSLNKENMFISNGNISNTLHTIDAANNAMELQESDKICSQALRSILKTNIEPNISSNETVNNETVTKHQKHQVQLPAEDNSEKTICYNQTMMDMTHKSINEKLAEKISNDTIFGDNFAMELTFPVTTQYCNNTESLDSTSTKDISIEESDRVASMEVSIKEITKQIPDYYDETLNSSIIIPARSIYDDITINTPSSLNLYRTNSLQTPNNTDDLCNLDAEQLGKLSLAKQVHRQDKTLSSHMSKLNAFTHLSEDEDINDTQFEIPNSFSSFQSPILSSPPVVAGTPTLSKLLITSPATPLEDNLPLPKPVSAIPPTVFTPKRESLTKRCYKCRSCRVSTNQTESMLQEYTVDSTCINSLTIDYSGFDQFKNTASLENIFKADKKRRTQFQKEQEAKARLLKEIDSIESQNVPAENTIFLWRNKVITKWEATQEENERINVEQGPGALLPLNLPIDFLLRNKFENDMSSWKYNGIHFPVGIIKLCHKKIPSLILVVKFDPHQLNDTTTQRNTNDDIVFKEILTVASNIRSVSSLSDIELLMHNELISKLPVGLINMCPTSRQFISFLDKIDAFYNNAYNKVKKLEAIGIEYQAYLERQNNVVCLKRFIVDWKLQRLTKIYIRIFSIDQLSRSDVTLSSNVLFSDSVNNVGTGLHFLFSFLSDPFSYLIENK